MIISQHVLIAASLPRDSGYIEILNVILLTDFQVCGIKLIYLLRDLLLVGASERGNAIIGNTDHKNMSGVVSRILNGFLQQCLKLLPIFRERSSLVLVIYPN